jgi:hypothetical protein
MKPGTICPGKGGPPGEPAGVYGGVGLGEFNKAFKAWYLGGNVGMTSGILWVLLGARVAAGISVWTLVVFAIWAISGGRTKW